MSFKPPPWLAVLLSLLATLFTGIVVAVEVADDGTIKVSAELKRPASAVPEKPVEVKVPGPADQTLMVDADQERDSSDVDTSLSTPIGEGIALHEDAVDETPPGITAEEVAKGLEKTEELAEDQLVAPEEPAGAQPYSCKDRSVVNQSALSGSRVGVALHFTVSPFGSLDAIFGLFNRSSFGASSNYGFELVNLRCQRWVPEGRKAWAQGAANSAYVSIEIMTYDLSRAQWLATPAFKRGVLAALVRDISMRIGSPLKHVDPVGCVWTPGIVDHDSLECGNTHWDVGPGFPWDVFMKQVKQGFKPNYSTNREQVLIKRLRSRRVIASRSKQRRTCKLAKRQLRRINPPYTKTEKTRHQGSRRKRLVKPYAKTCRK